MDPESHAPAAARAPLLDCKLCELTFDTTEERRQHAKSEWHVYKLRCKVAEPGVTITPPKSPSSKPKSRSRSPPIDQDGDIQSSEEDEEEEDSDKDVDEIEFIPEECLFCPHISSSFDANLAHMAQTHSLAVPFQSALVVDLQTLIWFLHMVIFSYRECISCGKRKRSVEAVQAHMTSLGHCRFNVTEEMEGFYDMEQLAKDAPEMGSNPDERTLRLPSGKLLGHRSYSDQSSNRRSREKSPSQQGALPAASSSSNHPTPSTSNALATKKDRKEAALTTQLAGLSKGDQMSLMHLPASQQRSLLVRHKKELDKAKRAERRKRGKLDRVGDKIAVHTNYYKQEVPIYSGG